MVPHEKIEEAIRDFVQSEDDEEVLVALTAVPDEKKGERLVLVHRKLSVTPTDICEHLVKLGLPNLWIPAPDSFLPVEEIPL